MTTKNPATPAPPEDTATSKQALNDAIRRYVRAYALRHDSPRRPSASAYHATPLYLVLVYNDDFT